MVKINPNNEMTKTCPQQINQRSHRHRDPMVQGDGKDALSVWKIAEKVCDDFLFYVFRNSYNCMLEWYTYNVIYACFLQRVRARDVQFHRRQHLRQAAKWKSEITQQSKGLHLFHQMMNLNIRSQPREPEVPLYLLQFIRKTIQLLQRQVYHLELLNYICRYWKQYKLYTQECNLNLYKQLLQ